MTDLTIAIRTYNRAHCLPPLLDALKTQIQADTFSWEVVIVDNNSTDNTAKIIQTYQHNWLPHVPLRYIFESQQGAAIARRRAIQAAQGTWIGFLDDDNVPHPDWVKEIMAFTAEYPQAGAFSSQIHGQFEAEPPANFERIAIFLPIMERPTLFRFDRTRKDLPPGAGLVVRRQAWLESVPTRLLLQGPVRHSLAIKGEDNEALQHLKNAGWEIWHNPALHIDHHIPQSRLEPNYLLQFCRSSGYSRHRLRMLRLPRWQQPLMIVAYLVNDLLKILQHAWCHRTHLSTDLIATCELQVLIGTFLSPFHLAYYSWIAAQTRQPES
jgi:glycosyltransferase involved in cell wall biosynthesis